MPPGSPFLPCSQEPNGWWDWNLQSAQCQQTNVNQVVAFVDGGVLMPLRPGRKCWSIWEYPATGYELQVWMKPLPKAKGAAGAGVAVLIINSNFTAPRSISVPLAKLQLAGPARVRDVWHHSDNGTATATFTATVPPADSVFVVLTPTTTLR